MTSFQSPKEEQFREVVAPWLNRSDIKVHYLSGTKDLKYFGRMQLGLWCQTSHVMFMDDDGIPGRKFFEFNMHVITTKEYRGMLTFKGFPDL